MSKKVKRLFEQFRPESYELSLDIKKTEMTFSGTVKISGKKVGRPSRRITLHQKDLRIKKANIYRHEKGNIHHVKVDRINSHKKYDEVRLHANEILYPGNYTIEITYYSKITESLHGLYPGHFKINNKDFNILSTQFESHYAREVLPCIDEPQAKATFQLTIKVDTNETVISNTSVKAKTNIKNCTLVEFEKTPIMSSYLLAFIIGEFEYIERKTKHGTSVRVYATSDKIQNTDFALDVAVKCLEFYEDYFAIPYPLPKCDLVALPDFAAGAMENWGCITFREQCLLVDPKNSSIGTKQFATTVIAHELAHQWFGNLVTMNWWSDLWLNEGFASWIEILATDHIFPDWKMWSQFIAGDQLEAMGLDQLKSTHPIEVSINHPDEIHTIFDAISYSKGASIIHMLNQYLGPDVFRDGLRLYLNQNSFKNTNTDNLWSALSEISGKNVYDFMYKWTTAPGFPLLNVDVEDQNITLSQRRFLLDASIKTDEIIWPLPLLTNNQHLPEIFDKKTKEFSSSDNSSLIINKNHTGFFRVAYNPTHLVRMGQLTKEGHLSELDRLGLLSDVLELSKAGHIKTEDALNLLFTGYKDEKDTTVWSVISAMINKIDFEFDGQEFHDLFSSIVTKFIEPEFEEIGWDSTENEPHLVKLRRQIILSLGVQFDSKIIIEKCKHIFNEAKSPDDIFADIRSIVYYAATKGGNEETFNKMLAWHDQSQSSEERAKLSFGLCSFTQKSLINNSLSLIKTKRIRRQDKGQWIATLFVNKHAQKQAWKWVQNNWIWLEKEFSTDMLFIRLPKIIGSSMRGSNFIEEYKQFFKSHRTPLNKRSYAQGLESLKWRKSWVERDFETTLNYIKLFQQD